MIEDYKIKHGLVDFTVVTADGTTRTIDEFNEDFQNEIDTQHITINLNDAYAYLGSVSAGISDGITHDDYSWDDIVGDITRAEMSLKKLKKSIEIKWKREVEDICYDS